MSFPRIAFLLCTVALIGWGLYTLGGERRAAEESLHTVQSTVQKIHDENQSLTAEIEYLSRPENLLKESRSQFNYRQEGEKLVIIVPESTTTLPNTLKKP